MPIKIQDDSGDKEFFTIIPNYIANHSTANDQALYFQMKRFAGETGECFATEKTLMGKLKIGKKAYDKSLTYLVDKGWVSYVGLTNGKTRPIKTYKINNIWKMNTNHYRKISSESTVSSKKISAESKRDKCQKQHKISAESNIEEEPIIRRTNKEELAEQSSAVSLNSIIDLFKEINPSYKKFFANTTQRGALERLVKQHGVKKVEWLLNVLPRTNTMKYAPVITTPLALENKLADLIVFIKKEQIKPNRVTTI